MGLRLTHHHIKRFNNFLCDCAGVRLAFIIFIGAFMALVCRIRSSVDESRFFGVAQLQLAEHFFSQR